MVVLGKKKTVRLDVEGLNPLRTVIFVMGGFPPVIVNIGFCRDNFRKRVTE